MTVKHLIIEEDTIHLFSDEIQHALSEGYTIAASNSFWNFGSNCIRYYALLTRFNDNDEIPFTLTVDRPSPMPLNI